MGKTTSECTNLESGSEQASGRKRPNRTLIALPVGQKQAGRWRGLTMSDARHRRPRQGRARRRPGSHPRATSPRQRRGMHVEGERPERMKCKNDKRASFRRLFFMAKGGEREASEHERESSSPRTLSTSSFLFSSFFPLCSGSLARQQQRATAAELFPSSTPASPLDRSSSSSSSSSSSRSSAADPPSWSQVSVSRTRSSPRSRRGSIEWGPCDRT